MIRSKRSKGDIAGTLWKAANAAAAFRPRPGGAGERLRQAAENKQDDGPDGITSVVPAPPRAASKERRDETPRPTSRDRRDETPRPGSRNDREDTPERPKSKASERHSLVPEVKITVPNSSRPSSTHTGLQEVKKSQDPAKEESRPSPLAGNDVKYLQSLGVETSILDDRSVEFCKWLDYFGWVPGEKMRARNVEEMKADLDRELNKAQAGGWLARFREEDERVDAIKRGIDIAISECEELDNLLTLYSVELSVC